MLTRKAVLFDLGGTLVRYWSRDEFPGILTEALAQTRDVLRQKKVRISNATNRELVDREGFEADDFRVRPLWQRLARIFELNEHESDKDIEESMCRAFMSPLFARAQLYPDSIPCLTALHETGLKTAIVSNAPWGSPAHLWREELLRLGLSQEVDEVVICGDVGWRKPDRRVFQEALNRLQVTAREALFVGDDPRWDLAGPQAIGMDAILIDREGVIPNDRYQTIRNLSELLERLNVPVPTANLPVGT